MILNALLGSIKTADWVFSFLTQSAVLLLIGWILTKVFKRASMPLKSGILMTLMILLILLPIWILIFKINQAALYRFPIPSIRQENSRLSSGQDQTLDEREKVQTGIDIQKQKTSNNQLVPPGKKADFLSFLSINPLLLFLNTFGPVWITGFLFFLGRFFYGVAFISRFRSSLLEIREEELTELLEPVQTAFPKTKLPSVYTSPAINSPMALGIFRPVIVLPLSLYQNLSSEELKSIMIHETAHIYHRDQVSGILQRFVIALYWWNPLAYALSANFSVAREYISDNYAIQKSGAYPYAKCLATLAQKTSLITHLPAAIGMATPHISLEERIKNIVSKERVMKTNLKKSMVLLLVLSALLLVAFLGRYSWTLTAEEFVQEFIAKTVPLPAGMEPFWLAVDKDQIYIAEEEGPKLVQDRFIAIFSLKDFSLLKKFGQKGKGVGEFLLGPGRFNLVDGSIWVEDLGKMLVFSRDGVFQKEIALPRKFMLLEYPLLPLGENYVTFAADRADIDNGILRYFGRIYDPEFRAIKQFYEETPILGPPPPPPPPPPAGRKEEIKQKEETLPRQDYQAVPDCIDFTVAEGKIFVADTRKGFHISVFDSQGNLLYEISKDYEKLKIPNGYAVDFMEKIKEKAGWLNDVANFKFREYYPAFFSFKIADNKIYVSTYAEKDSLHELVIMNLSGNVLKKTFAFPLDPSYDSLYSNFSVARNKYAIHDDKIYYLNQNKRDGSYELQIQEIK